MSRYLLDENLPATLAPLLGGDCLHAATSGRATDNELWLLARQERRIVLTKDADFFEKLLLEGPPPQVVWFRIVNLRRAQLEEIVVKIWPAVTTLLATCDLVEVHQNKLEGLRRGDDSAHSGPSAPDQP